MLVTGGRVDLEFALALADTADGVALRYFSDEDLDVIRKVDGSPVTAADLEVESQLHAAVGDEFPTDGFLGEEVGESAGSSRRWIVDGIDGTRLFIDGKLTWGTLIALEIDGDVVVGVASSPTLGRRWWASRDEGAFTSGADGHEPVALRVSATSDLDAAVGLILPRLDGCPSDHRAAAGRLVDAGLVVDRDWHHALRVAEGDVDLSAHFSGGPWDHAALVVIVEEAGGCSSDLSGGRQLDTRTALFTNGALHRAALELLAAGDETAHLRPG